MRPRIWTTCCLIAVAMHDYLASGSEPEPLVERRQLGGAEQRDQMKSAQLADQPREHGGRYPRSPVIRMDYDILHIGAKMRVDDRSCKPDEPVPMPRAHRRRPGQDRGNLSNAPPRPPTFQPIEALHLGGGNRPVAMGVYRVTGRTGAGLQLLFHSRRACGR